MNIEDKKPKKIYSQTDLIKFENKERYSSLGKQIVSTKSSSAIFRFGTCKKDAEKKRFIGQDFAKIEQRGQNSPGPAYNIREEAEYLQYLQGPKAVIGQKSREMLENNPKYDYYLRNDTQFYPDKSCLLTKIQDPKTTIGLEERFPAQSRFKGTPGPQYKQEDIFKGQWAPKYSFGIRKLKDYAAQIQTPKIVGPGTYIENQVPKTSLQQESPSYSIGKQQKMPNQHHGFDKYQTYDTQTKAIGKSFNSRIQSQPNFTIPKSSRDAKLGIFQSDFVGNQPRLRIQLPQF